jgi:Lipocalin-like domain
MKKPAAKLTLRDQVIGAWTLVAFVSRLDGGPPAPVFQRATEGVIMYSADGYVSVNIMVPGRTRFAAEDYFAASTAELKEAAAGYVAYAGPFRVDEAKQQMIHDIDVSLFPNWVGVAQIRDARLDGDTLTLSTDNQPMPTADGRSLTFELIWNRVALRQ